MVKRNKVIKNVRKKEISEDLPKAEVLFLKTCKKQICILKRMSDSCAALVFSRLFSGPAYLSQCQG